MRTVEFILGNRRMVLFGAHPTYLRAVEGDQSHHPLVTLMRDLPHPAICLDVGANIGLTSLIMASRSPDDRVFAFEPVRENAALMRENLAANQIKNCTVIETAVGDAHGSVPMSSNGPWSIVGLRTGSRRVPVTRLDPWCEFNLPGTRIDLIKIDVEGYEPDVLAGAAIVIERWRPVIFMEFNSWTLLLQGYNPLAFAAFIWSAFDVRQKDGSAAVAADDFVHDNMVHSRCVDDLILMPRPGARVAPADEIRFGSQGIQAQKMLDAVHKSTSWRLTAPVRALKTSLSRR